MSKLTEVLLIVVIGLLLTLGGVYYIVNVVLPLFGSTVVLTWLQCSKVVLAVIFVRAFLIDAIGSVRKS